QTEDLGQTYSTPPLADQAAFENHRRWLTWDLLTGRVTRDHPFWPRLKRFGVTDRIKRINEAPCPPDIIGVNHYLTSERFLDHRTDRYPRHRIGGNRFVRYADVEAVRVLNPGPVGLQGVMQQAWERYRLPMAVTEATTAAPVRSRCAGYGKPGRRRRPCATAARTCARSPPGRCWAAMTGTAC
ncbi:MAG: hypothetical protein ACXWVH_09010, partial [Caulobacteraceae bacterium]